ncbi:Abhydrolase-2 domain-containing protein [Fusarium sp. Ph1]|nr:Abhydrolase-2 domain-containing protein [Fusarium sp. Ph1]
MSSQVPSVGFHPANPDEHTHTVIFLHGEDETARLCAQRFGRLTGSCGQTLRQEFPTIRWVFPTAPSANGWFPVLWRYEPTTDQHLQTEGLSIAVMRLRSVIHREAETLGRRYHRIVIAGFSQGASVAVLTLLNFKFPEDLQVFPRLGGLFCVAGRLPFAGRDLEQIRTLLDLPDKPTNNLVVSHTPILVQHNHDDQDTPVRHGCQTYDGLDFVGATPIWREYLCGGHWFNRPAGVDDLVAFLGTALGIGRWGQNRGDVIWSGRLPMPSQVEVAAYFGKTVGEDEW